jgi:hypothetical protein
MSAIENVEKSLRDNLNAEHKKKHSGIALINGLIAFCQETGDGTSAFKAGIERFVKVIGESRISKEENWDDKKCRGYLRQFMYDARQAMDHGLVTDKGLAVDGKPIETHRELRKVTEAKRAEKAKPDSAGRASGTIKSIGEAAYNKATKALEPCLPQLVEHGQLQNLAAWLQEKTGYNWTVYKK